MRSMYAPPKSPPSRKAVEELWRDRLHQSKDRYNVAAATSRYAMKTFLEDSAPTPDGGVNLRNCLQAESAALSEYMRILRVFTDLTLNGTLPEE